MKPTDCPPPSARILVLADDLSDFAECVTDVLEDNGLRATGVRTRDFICGVVEPLPGPDCIIVDLDGPEAAAADFAARLKQLISEKVPLLGLSSDSRSKQEPWAEVLVKPFEIESLLTAVERLTVARKRGPRAG